MKNPIEVKYFRECIPTKGVWYSLHGDVFISVMLKSKPHVRRKAIPPDNKRDNKLSDWHREWQYDKIENQYGEVGSKTYEENIIVDNETHRIDSLVKNVAIEFQHTLSVSLDEMNARFIAHRKYGYIPYLVINLTSSTFSEFTSSFSSDEKSPLKTKLNKWTNSEYCKANKLFIDLDDCMVRVVNSIESGYLTLRESQFVQELLCLEKDLVDKIKNDRERIKRREEQRIIDKKRADKRALEKERESFYHEKLDNPDFKFYRFCFANPIIKPYVMTHNGEIFEYWSDSEMEYGYLEKYHRYYSKESNFEILYKTVSKIIETEISTYRGLQTKKEFKYDYAEIHLKEQYKIIAKFKRKGNRIELIPE
ncbi:MAG: hypothetical protein KDD32_05950 [Bacteroidetes bacterium]|nr:hypothetical protein [Bacteroidota bacterium]